MIFRRAIDVFFARKISVALVVNQQKLTPRDPVRAFNAASGELPSHATGRPKRARIRLF
jgi:hypothetical protein